MIIWKCNTCGRLIGGGDFTSHTVPETGINCDGVMVRLGKVFNHTGHDVTLKCKEGTILFHSMGLARVVFDEQEQQPVAGMPAMTREIDHVVGLPPPVPNTFYIVSGYVRKACSERTDLLVPAACNGEKGETRTVTSVPGWIVNA